MPLGMLSPTEGLGSTLGTGSLRGGDSGAAIVPGDVDKSRLIEAVRYKNPDLQMPPKSPSATEIATFEKWVLDGCARSARDRRTARPRNRSA